MAPHVYTDCRAALAESVRVCGRPSTTEEYASCMSDRMGIEVGTSESCAASGTTPCVLSSDSVAFCTRCVHATATPQIVHAVGGMYGGPSKITEPGKSS